jgi:hypothetical protein
MKSLKKPKMIKNHPLYMAKNTKKALKRGYKEGQE